MAVRLIDVLHKFPRTFTNSSGILHSRRPRINRLPSSSSNKRLRKSERGYLHGVCMSQVRCISFVETGVGHGIGWLVAKFLDKAAAQVPIEKGDPESLDIETARTSLQQLDQKMDSVTLVQQMQTLVPIVTPSVSHLINISRQYPDLQIEEVMSCHQDVSKSIIKLQHKVFAVDGCTEELESLVNRYVTFGTTVLNIISEYNSRGRVGRWLHHDSIMDLIQRLKTEYHAFLRAFQLVLQVDTRIAVEVEQKMLREEVHGWINSVEKVLVTEADCIRTQIHDMNSSMHEVHQSTTSGLRDCHEGTDRNLKIDSSINDPILKQSLELLVRQSDGIVENQKLMGSVISRMVDMQKEQNDFAMEQGRRIMKQVEYQNQLIVEQSRQIQALIALSTPQESISERRLVVDGK